MWSALLAVVLLDLSSTGFASGETSDTRIPPGQKVPTAFIRYPEAALEYFLKTRAHRDINKCLAEFKDLLPVRREKICVKYLVEAESFSLSSIGRRHNYSITADDFESLVCDTYNSLSDTFIDDFVFKGSDGAQYRTSAQLCVISDGNGVESWTISPSHDEGVMFLHIKSLFSDIHHLSGLLEEMPDIQRDDWDQQQVEKWYVANRIERSKMAELDYPPENDNDNNASRSLCEMNNFERFRACGVGFLAWKHSKNDQQAIENKDEADTKGNFIDMHFPEDVPKCIKSNVELSIDAQNKISAIDVIPCAINKEMRQADFFLTHDPISPTSMFTVLPVWKDIHGSHHLLGNEVDALFKLEMYMTNVRVLKSFNELP